jgi:phage shock protein B
MMDDLTAIIICGMLFLGPTWIVFQFLGRSRAARALNEQDAASIGQLTETAARMEARMATLERILDAEVPAWRSKFDAGGLR